MVTFPFQINNESITEIMHVLLKQKDVRIERHIGQSYCKNYHLNVTPINSYIKDIQYNSSTQVMQAASIGNNAWGMMADRNMKER